MVTYRHYVFKDALPLCEDFLNSLKIDYQVINEEKDTTLDDTKKIIYKINKGKFLTPCPGTPKYVCCGYYVLAPVENCPFECSYCILNAYFKTRDIVVYVNIDDMIRELNEIKNKSIKRIGTGEFSDSLAISETRLYLAPLLDFFEENEDLFLELKTKSSYIPPIFLEKNYRNIIFSWSLNSSKITNFEEHNTSSIDERIEAAKKINQNGYRVSFHFDPIIYYDGWEKDYGETIKKIFENINKKDILWISLGTLRFIPELKDIATTLYPESNIFYDEFIKAIDGKNRYFRKKRSYIYKEMLSMIKSYSPDTFVYLCMENEDVWQEVFGVEMSTKRLKEMMDERL